MNDVIPASTFDTPIERASLQLLPIETIDAELDAIRIRRMSLQAKYQAAVEEKALKMHVAYVQKYSKAVDAIKRKLDKVNTEIEAAEVLVNKLRVIKMEAGL